MSSTQRLCAHGVRDLLISARRQARVTRVRDHRPWPLPKAPWIMAQSWVDLLFAHWRVPPAALDALVPPQLTLDTFDGSAWIGVTPFEVRDLRLRALPPLPPVSCFPELNVRTYVVYGGMPGIFFFSLDAASRLGVATARRTYLLPYFHARMSIERTSDRLHYSSHRTDSRTPGATAGFRAAYRPTGSPAAPRPDTIEHWLTERYCLYTLSGRRVYRGEIHHRPWPLQPADATIDDNTMTAPIGISLSGEPLLHYSARQDVVFWPLMPAGSPRRS